MAEINFKESATRIVELVGGKENIENVAHCITRVRFTLKDQGVAQKNKTEITKVNGVIQVVEAGGQFQVVIGPKVSKMYDEVVAITGDRNGDVSANEATGTKKKMKISDMIMKLVSGIMMPTLPAMIGCGLVASLVNVLMLFGFGNDNGTYTILYGIGQTCIYFFPVIVGGAAAKYFGISPYLGNVIGACLIYPDFLTAAAAGETTTFLGFIPLAYKSYTSTVFPAIVAVWFASVLFKFFKKHIPDLVSFIFVPFLTVIITVPVALIAIGPVVNGISGIISNLSLAIFNLSPILCGIFLGATWLLFIVPLGLHWGFMAIFMNNLMTIGYEPIMGLLCGIAALSGTLVAVGIRSKNPMIKSTAFSTAVSNMLGVSEPGLYGIVLQHKETILTTAIGGGIAGIIPAVCHTYIYSFAGSAGIFAFPMYINPDGSMSSLIGMIACNVAAFVLCFILTMVWKFDPDQVTE